MTDEVVEAKNRNISFF